MLNFFRMAALMKGNRVSAVSDGAVPLDAKMASGVGAAPDIDVLATASTREAAVMLWNYHDEEKSGASAPVSMAVTGLPKSASRVLVTHYRIDDTHSNAYTVWKAMGSPQKPSPEQIAELKAKAGLQLLESPRWMTVQSGTVKITTDMPRHAVSLIQLSW